MPKVRQKHLPRPLLDHLLDRIRQREIPLEDLGRLDAWLSSAPDVPEGRWFKKFPGMIVCGEGELVKTFLRIGQVASGTEVP